MPHKLYRPAAFTLIEILIVVILLGILAAVVVPQFTSASQDSRERAFQENLRQLVVAGSLYYSEHGALPAQAALSPVPPEMLQAAGRDGEFQMETPLGGYWHVGYFADLNKWGVGVWWPSDADNVNTEANIRAVDVIIDDGDSATGAFQVRDGARYYWLVH